MNSLQVLRGEVLKAKAFVREANVLSQEMGKKTEFNVTLQIPASCLSPNRRVGWVKENIYFICSSKEKSVKRNRNRRCLKRIGLCSDCNMYRSSNHIYGILWENVLMHCLSVNIIWKITLSTIFSSELKISVIAICILI